jgi:hypothetical protein
MSFKTTYILFGVFLLMIGVFGLILWLEPTKSIDTAYVLPTLHDPANPVEAKDVTQIEIERTRPNAEKLVFERDADQRWQMTSPHHFRVDQWAANQIVSEVLGAKKNEKRDVTPSLKQWGLEEPAAVITLKKGDEREWKLNLGDQSGDKTGAVVYVSSSDRNEPMAINRSDLDGVFKPVKDFRAKDLLAESAFDIQYLALKDSKHPQVAVEKTADGQWKFKEPAGYGGADYEGEPPGTGPNPAKTTSGIRSTLETAAQLRVASADDFVADDVSDLAKYGLEADKHDGPRIEVKRNASGFGNDKKPAVQQTLLVGKKSPDKPDKVFARLEDEKNVVLIDAKNVEAVSKLLDNPGAFRDRDLVHLDQARADAVDIKPATGPALKFRKVDFQWKMFADNAAGQKADSAAVEALLNAVAAKRQIKEFPDPKVTEADLGLANPSVVVSIWQDGIAKEEKKDEKKDADKPDEKKDDKKNGDKKDEKKEEKKDDQPKLKSDKPTVKLSFGKREASRGIVYLKRESGEESLIVAVSDALLTHVSDGPLTYMDRSLPQFDANTEVAKLTVNRADGVYEAEKETKDGKKTWKLKQPASLAGRTASEFNIENIVSTLRFLQATRLVAEKPSDADLDAKYGLKSPAVKVTLTLKKGDKPEDWVYSFGKETDDKTGVYARQNQRDIVFIVAKGVLNALSSDLQDPTVLSMDLGKVEGMKITGWHDSAGEPLSLEMEYKMGQWAAKTPANFKLDDKKAAELLAAMDGLKATKFVAEKPGAKPEHELDLKAGALEVTLTVKNEKEPTTVIIGGLDADGKNYYATTSKMPGQLFLLPKEKFEKFKGMRSYFSKKE